MLLKNSIIYFLLKKREKDIDDFISNPIKYQDQTFSYLIMNGEKTMYGKKYNFNKIKNYKDFKDNVPIYTYEELEKYIDLIRKGERDILWPGKIKRFAISSGTSNGKSKFIPISKECLRSCHYKSGKDMLCIYQKNFQYYDLYNGKGVMLGGAITDKNKIYKEGDLSALLLFDFPRWVKMHRVPDFETAIMKNWEKKLDSIAKQAIKENITNLTGIPSWMLLLLNKVIELSGKENITQIWPNLELYMHGGVNFEPYRKQFEKLIPSKKMNYLEGYNASEGFFAIQDKKISLGLLLMVNNGIFYEFIPMNKFKKNIYEAISLKSVQIGTEYAIVISTNTGLWRYLIGDVIKFTTIQPYRIKVVGRTKNFINSFGEELMIHNTDDAIKICCKLHDCSIKEYTVAPYFLEDGSGGHEWFIEFYKEPKNLNSFMLEIDLQIKKINSDYEAKRKFDLVLKKPKFNVLKKNEFFKWLKEKDKLGGQNKIPRLMPNRSIANELISIQKRSFQQ